MQEEVTENKWPEKCRSKKGLEFDGLKNKGQIVKKISESVDVGISDDQQQQTESTPSATDTTSAVKPVISANNCYCYTDLTLHNLHFFKSLKSIHVTHARTDYSDKVLSTRHNSFNRTVNSSHDFRLWRVDWHPRDLA